MAGITDFPPEILSVILSYKAVSHQTIALFLCGNKRLSTLLASGGATLVELKHGNRQKTPFFPKCLRALRGLRSLSISCAPRPLNSTTHLGLDITMLSPSIESLKLDFPGADLDLLPARPKSFMEKLHWQFRELVGSMKPLTWHEVFPSLHKLELSDCLETTFSRLPSLPSSLQTCIFGFFNHIRLTIGDARAVPSNLTHLELIDAQIVETEILQALPPSLTFLKVDIPSKGNHSLRTLKQGPQTYDDLISALKCLPPNLTSLSDWRLSEDVLKAGVLPIHLRSLQLRSSSLKKLSALDSAALFSRCPPYLTLLDARVSVLSPEALCALPRCLEALHVRSFSYWSSLAPEHFPPALTGLNILDAELESDSPLLATLLERFPSTLKQFLWHGPNLPLLRPLAPSLTNLNYDKVEYHRGDVFLPLPVMLRTLITRAIIEFDSELCRALPRTLTHFMVPNSSIWASGIQFLPPMLRFLYGGDYHVDGDLHPDLWLKNLPQNLKHLTLRFQSLVSAAAVANVPRGLKYLSLRSSMPSPTEALHNLPPKLTTLILSVDRFSDQEYSKLPPRLAHLVLYATENTSTKDFTHPNLTSSTIHPLHFSSKMVKMWQ